MGFIFAVRLLNEAVELVESYADVALEGCEELVNRFRGLLVPNHALRCTALLSFKQLQIVILCATCRLRI